MFEIRAKDLLHELGLLATVLCSGCFRWRVTIIGFLIGITLRFLLFGGFTISIFVSSLALPFGRGLFLRGVGSPCLGS